MPFVFRVDLFAKRCVCSILSVATPVFKRRFFLPCCLVAWTMVSERASIEMCDGNRRDSKWKGVFLRWDAEEPFSLFLIAMHRIDKVPRFGVLYN